MKLTPKQERFVQRIVSGLSQRDAYKQAYNCGNMQDATIDSRASKLFKEYKISTRYNEIMDAHKKKALWDREKAVIDSRPLSFILNLFLSLINRFLTCCEFTRKSLYLIWK